MTSTMAARCVISVGRQGNELFFLPKSCHKNETNRQQIRNNGEMQMNKFPKEAPAPQPHLQQLAKEVWEQLSCKDVLTRTFIQVLFTAIKVFDWKQTNYGVKNIQRAGADGVRIRLGDKVSRLDNLMAKNENPVEESIEDTFGDIGNYGFIGLMCRWGWWPGVVAEQPTGDNNVLSN